MPLVSYRASAESFLREIHEVAGHRASAKQTLEVITAPETYEREVLERSHVI